MHLRSRGKIAAPKSGAVIKSTGNVVKPKTFLPSWRCHQLWDTVRSKLFGAVTPVERYNLQRPTGSKHDS